MALNNKTLLAVSKVIRNIEREPGEQRRIDALVLELRCVSITILIGVSMTTGIIAQMWDVATIALFLATIIFLTSK